MTMNTGTAVPTCIQEVRHIYAEPRSSYHTTMPTWILEVRHIHEDPERNYHIKVERNSRGENWEISIRALTLEETLALVNEAYRKLEAQYSAIQCPLHPRYREKKS